MSINLIDFFTYFKGTPNQKAAIGMLAEVMPASLMVDDASWVEKFREPEPVPESALPPEAVDLICEFEGFVSYPYNDRQGWRPLGRLNLLLRWAAG